MQAAKAAAPTRSSLPRSSKTGDETHTMAVMLTLFVGPWLGFLYLGRRGFACAYVAYSAAIIVLFTQFYFEDWVFHATAPYSFLYFLLVHVAGALHCANRGYGTAPGPSEFTDRQIARVLVLPAFLLIMLALLLSIFATQRQPGPSMAPSYSINAPYIFNRLAFRFREPQRGDVILYRTKV